MSEQNIITFERRYTVEIAERIRFGYDSYRTEWHFDRAFKTLEDAEAYADRISEDNEQVRIIYKGEA